MSDRPARVDLAVYCDANGDRHVGIVQWPSLIIGRTLCDLSQGSRRFAMIYRTEEGEIVSKGYIQFHASDCPVCTERAHTIFDMTEAHK